MVFAERDPPGFVTVTYDQPILVPGLGEVAPWAIVFGGFTHPVTDLEFVPPSQIRLQEGAPGAPTAGETLSYVPPPVAITGLTGVPALTQVDFTLD